MIKAMYFTVRNLAIKYLDPWPKPKVKQRYVKRRAGL